MKRLSVGFFSFFLLQNLCSQSVAVRTEIRDSTIFIECENNLPTTITIHFVSKVATLDVKEWHRLPAGEYGELFKIPQHEIPEGKDFNDMIRIFYLIGDPNGVKHNDKYRYHFPFAKNKSSKIVQSYKGNFSHQSNHSRYAIDFKMEIGDTIYAAREGTAAWVVEHNAEGGNDRKFLDKANEIMIEHDDGSIAVYSHLAPEGSFVDIGDEIKLGQAIGICGLTGFTTTPHLHFVVRIIDKNGEPLAIPTLFERKPGKKLKKDKIYRH